MVRGEVQKPPPELGKAGLDLWNQVCADIEVSDPRELIVLRQSCLLQDDLERLRDELKGAPLITKGSTGQPVESPLLASIRAAVSLQSKLLQSIAVSTDAASSSQAGRRLVAHRYAKKAG